MGGLTRDTAALLVVIAAAVVFLVAITVRFTVPEFAHREAAPQGERPR